MAKKILLADDSITIQKVVELTFSDGDYEVVATNNGNKAIQKLAEVRPDIILSDIIMPEKNGYELCEYIKSHPDYRHIPVVLLTGTFEPFDPDRAEKAGCDAVITKPFESQSLIHKVEELIEQSAASAAGKAATTTAPVAAITSEPAKAATQPVSAIPPAAPASALEEHDVFQPAKPAASSAFEEASEFQAETRAMPKMSFEDLQQQSSPAFEPPQPEVDYGGATKAFPKMSFEELKQMSMPETPEQPETTPPETGWSAPEEAAPASEWASPGESSFTTPPAAEPEAEPSWPSAPPGSPPSTAARAAESPEGFASPGGKLSDEEVDRIARRVIELMSDQVVRTIAWEVIPDLAEMVVRERIRQLESES